MKKTSLIFLFALSVFNTYALTARVQLINNSPDTSLSSLNFYLDGILLTDSLAFRSATPFINVTAGLPVTLAVALESSTDVSQAFYTFDYTFVSNQKYILVANGELNPNVYNPFQAFSLDLFEGALELGSTGAGTDILFCQGSPDAGTVDIEETDLIQLTAFDNIAYETFSGYLNLFAANYTLAMTNAEGTAVYGSFSAPFADYGWGGDAITILSSGFLNQTINNNGSVFGLWAATSSGGPLVQLPVLNLNLTAQVQFIHNSADASAAELDVYVNGQLQIDNFLFHTSSPFMDIQAGMDIAVAIAPGNSNNASDAFETYTLNFFSGQHYTAVVNGIIASVGYDPILPLSLNVYSGSFENSPVPTEIMILSTNGSTDLSVIDISETLVWNSSVVSDLGYGSFSSYFSVPENGYEFTVYDGTSSNFVGSFQAPFSTMGLGGQAITLVAGGFTNSELNSNGEPFGLWISLASGGALIPLQLTPPPPVFAQVQFVHDCADGNAAVVDVYLNETLFINDFSFHNATSFELIPANVPIVIKISPSDSQNAENPLATLDYTLVENEKYYALLSGIVSSSGYNPAPQIEMKFFSGARLNANLSSETDIVFYHGSTDCSSIDVNELTLPLDGWVNNLAYGEFSNYLNLSADNNYAIGVTDDAGAFTFGTYNLLLSTLNLAGKSAIVFSNGFVNPTNNSDGIAFSMWLALADGTTSELSFYTRVEEKPLPNLLNAFPNPAQSIITLKGMVYSNANLKICIVNSFGQEIRTQKVIAQNNQINCHLEVDGLADGLYNIIVSDQVRFDAIPFVIRH